MKNLKKKKKTKNEKEIIKKGIYTIRLNNNKNALLQACFLRDVRVIRCNSLSNSRFQTYVMNNAEIVIDYYLHITSHVSHAFTSCTHFTSYSLLSFVHGIVHESIWSSKIMFSMVFDAKYV